MTQYYVIGVLARLCNSLTPFGIMLISLVKGNDKVLSPFYNSL